jgi:hypothetical protein
LEQGYKVIPTVIPEGWWLKATWWLVDIWWLKTTLNATNAKGNEMKENCM